MMTRWKLTAKEGGDRRNSDERDFFSFSFLACHIACSSYVNIRKYVGMLV
jgi:hypothetical protein